MMTIAEKIEGLRQDLETLCADFESTEGVIVIGDITTDGVSLSILTKTEAEEK